MQEFFLGGVGGGIFESLKGKTSKNLLLCGL